MDFNPTTCSDCSYPPNFIVSSLPKRNNRQFFSVKCRDCGDIWEESPDLDDKQDDSE